MLRTGAEVLPQDELAHRLVLSGMATLLFVDIEGSRCSIKYTAELVLSNTVRIQMNSLKFLSEAIKQYIRRLDQGAFHEAGLAGELIGRLVLLRAFDKSLRFGIGNNIIPKVDSPPLNPSEINAETDSFPWNNSASVPDPGIFKFIQDNLDGAFTPKFGIVKLKDFLMQLTGFDESELEYWKFGVGEDVMDGSVWFQSINLSSLRKSRKLIKSCWLMLLFAVLA